MNLIVSLSMSIDAVPVSSFVLLVASDVSIIELCTTELFSLFTAGSKDEDGTGDEETVVDGSIVVVVMTFCVVGGSKGWTFGGSSESFGTMLSSNASSTERTVHVML